MVARKKNNCNKSTNLILGKFYYFIMLRGIFRFSENVIAGFINQEQLKNLKWLSVLVVLSIEARCMPGLVDNLRLCHVSILEPLSLSWLRKQHILFQGSLHRPQIIQQHLSAMSPSYDSNDLQPVLNPLHSHHPALKAKQP